MATAASERARKMRVFIGKRVRVTLRGSDVSDREAVVLDGTVYSLALRAKGAASWNGHQYDMVLDCPDRIVRTFALSRIQEIEERVSP